MQHFKQTSTGLVYAYASEEEREYFGVPDLVAMTQGELDQHIAAHLESPLVVSRFQARAALHAFEMLDQVDELMNRPETDPLHKLAWTDAQEFRRQSPTVLSMAATLGLTDAQLDALFTTAAGVEA